MYSLLSLSDDLKISCVFMQVYTVYRFPWTSCILFLKLVQIGQCREIKQVWFSGCHFNKCSWRFLFLFDVKRNSRSVWNGTSIISYFPAFLMAFTFGHFDREIEKKSMKGMHACLNLYLRMGRVSFFGSSATKT